MMASISWRLCTSPGKYTYRKCSVSPHYSPRWTVSGKKREYEYGTLCRISPRIQCVVPTRYSLAVNCMHSRSLYQMKQLSVRSQGTATPHSPLIVICIRIHAQDVGQ